MFVHAITDGRDTSPTGGVALHRRSSRRSCRRPRTGRIATVVRPLLRDGSRQALGADQARLRRDRQRAGRDDGAVAADAIQASYEAGVTDEFIKPIVIVGADGQPIGPIRDGDSVVFFNFRADRARQLTRAIALDDFDGFERPAPPARPLHDDDGVRPHVQPAGRVHAADVQRQPRGRARRARAHEPPARRDREVRARHLLLQLRTRGAVSRARIGSWCRRRRSRPTT